MIRVLIVDDSAVVRQHIRFILQKDPELQVVGEARHGEEAVALAQRLKPDVITMDIRMPKMDGLEAIRHIMAQCPVPIVVVTALDLDREKDVPSQAIKLGAVSVLKTPASIRSPDYEAMAARLIEQVKIMSEVRVITRPLTWNVGRQEATAETRQPREDPALTLGAQRRLTGTESRTQVIAIGASTGGPAALYQILGALPGDFDIPILVVQHIAFGFVKGLAGWLDGGCNLRVKVAEAGERIRAGLVFIAPDDHHMVVDGYGRIRLQQTEPVNGHRPSVTVLFESVARVYGSAAVGVILTGMGADGAVGMKALREAGATTIAQDEASCVVFGMPKEAMAMGAVEHVVPLGEISQTITALCRRETV